MGRPRTFREPVKMRALLAPNWLWLKVRQRAEVERTSMSELICRTVVLYLLDKKSE